MGAPRICAALCSEREVEMGRELNLSRSPVLTAGAGGLARGHPASCSAEHLWLLPTPRPPRCQLRHNKGRIHRGHCPVGLLAWALALFPPAGLVGEGLGSEVEGHSPAGGSSLLDRTEATAELPMSPGPQGTGPHVRESRGLNILTRLFPVAQGSRRAVAPRPF